MDEGKAIIENLQNLADAVRTLFGKNCEACVHDLTRLPHSLVYLRGTVTNRSPGAPATDLLLKLIRGRHDQGLDMHNYETRTEDGRSLKSATTLFHDSTGRAVAAFCINFDTTDYYNAHQALLPFINPPGSPKIQEKSPETFARSVNDTVKGLFDSAVGEVGKQPATMDVEERTHLVQILDAHGAFQLKGSVEKVAELMGVTKYTVYNYMRKIRNAALRL